MGYGSSQHIELISKQKYFDKNMNKVLKKYLRGGGGEGEGRGKGSGKNVKHFFQLTKQYYFTA